MLCAPRSVTHDDDPEHVKRTISGEQLLKVPLAQGVSCVDPGRQKAPNPQIASTAGEIQTRPAGHTTGKLLPSTQKVPEEQPWQLLEPVPGA